MKPITDEEWNATLREIKFDMPFYYRLYVMAGLKQLDSERFNKENLLDKDFWEMATELAKEALIYSPFRFTRIFSDLYALDPIKAKKLCSLKEDQWETLLDKISSMSDQGYDAEVAFLVAQAQQLKPEGSKRDAILTEEQWKKALQEMKRTNEYGAKYKFMFYFAKLKDLKIG